MLPETYSAAEGYAFQIECENSNLISKRNESLNNVDESSQKVDQNLNSFNENQSYSNKSIHAKLNALEKQIVDWNGMGPQNE